MCHVSEISVANRPFAPPPIPGFRRTSGGQPRPRVWARERMRHSELGREAAWSRQEIPVKPQGGSNMAPKDGGPKGARPSESYSVMVYNRK